MTVHSCCQDEAKDRIAAQVSRQELAMACDLELRNDGDLTNLENQVQVRRPHFPKRVAAPLEPALLLPCPRPPGKGELLTEQARGLLESKAPH